MPPAYNIIGALVAAAYNPSPYPAVAEYNPGGCVVAAFSSRISIL
jgi:hypothetical protein